MSDDEMTADIKQLTGMAKRIGLKGNAVGRYVREHMEKMGYEAVENVTFKRKERSGGGKSGGGFLASFLGSDDSGDDDD